MLEQVQCRDITIGFSLLRLRFFFALPLSNDSKPPIKSLLTFDIASVR